jgi:hypothetical protein
MGDKPNRKAQLFDFTTGFEKVFSYKVTKAIIEEVLPTKKAPMKRALIIVMHCKP